MKSTIVALVIALLLPCLPSRAQDSVDDAKAELEELKLTLLAAVMSGTMERDEAIAVYQAVEASLAAAWEEEKPEEAWQPEPDDPKGRVLRLAPAYAGRIRFLLQPEFLGRDLAILHDELELDGGQLAIVEMLLRDYRDALEIASLPLQESLDRYRRESRDAMIASALGGTAERLDAARPDDTRAAVARMRETLDRILEENAERLEAAGERRAELDAWMQRMMEATAELDERLAAIGERVKLELAEIDSETTVSAADVVRAAESLRAERDALREELVIALELVTTDDQRGAEHERFEAALARVRVSHLLPEGRIGGEAMNLWAALDEVDPGPLEYAEPFLREQTIPIAAALDARTSAAIDREIAGLDLEVEGASARAYAEAARREIDAAVAVRDLLRVVLDESSAFIEEMLPGTAYADLYREAALRRGFPAEMRGRWCEVAVTGALGLDDLDDDQHAAILSIGALNQAELAMVRAAAVAACIDRDPRLARAFVDVRLGGGGKDDIEWTPDMWLGLEHEAFASIDERTETQLRGILTSGQFETLPMSPRARAEREAEGRREREAFITDLRRRIDAGEIDGQEARRLYAERYPDEDK